MKRILIVGFQGSKYKHFSKHIKIYKKFTSQIDVFTPGYLTNYDPKLVYPFAKEIEKRVSENDGKTLIHFFSGGLYPGSIALNYILLNNQQDKIAGMVWESSPVECGICSAARALSINLKEATGISIPKIVSKTLINSYNKKNSLEMNVWCDNFYRIIESEAVKNIPKIVIHGENDTILPNPKKFLIKHPEIPFYEFKNADHNKSILVDPEKYKNTINQFVNQVYKF